MTGSTSQTLAVLLPVRESDPFLATALRSLSAQSYSNWFCYLIADGDPTGASEIASSELDSSRFCLLSYPIKKRGLAAGLNYGLRLIKEGLVARFDSDDVCLPSRFETQVKLFQSTPNLAIACAPVEWIDESGQSLNSTSSLSRSSTVKRQLGLFNPIAHSSVMFRRQPVIAIGGYNPLAVGCEDYDLWLRLLSKKDNQLAICQQPLVLYRKHSDQLTRKSMVGTQLKVVESSRKEYLLASASIPRRLGAGIKSSLWSSWQRVRFP